MRLFPGLLLLAQFTRAEGRLEAQGHQWFAAVHAAPAAFGSGANVSTPSPGDVPEFGPGSSLRGDATFGRRVGRWEFSVAGSYGTHGLRGGDGSAWVTVEPGYTLATGDVLGAYAFVNSAAGMRLQLFAGPSVQFWSGEAVSGSRTRLGARGGIQLLTPIAGMLSLDTRAALGVAASPITQEELAVLGSTYDTGALWSRELGVGLRLSF